MIIYTHTHILVKLKNINDKQKIFGLIRENDLLPIKEHLGRKPASPEQQLILAVNGQRAGEISPSLEFCSALVSYKCGDRCLTFVDKD